MAEMIDMQTREKRPSSSQSDSIAAGFEKILKGLGGDASREDVVEALISIPETAAMLGCGPEISATIRDIMSRGCDYCSEKDIVRKCTNHWCENTICYDCAKVSKETLDPICQDCAKEE